MKIITKTRLLYEVRKFRATGWCAITQSVGFCVSTRIERSVRARGNSCKALKILLLLLFSTPLFAGGLEIQNAWIAEAPPGARVLAGYMRLQNNSDHTIVVNAITSPAARSSMLHKTVYEAGMARMVHQASIKIPAGESVTLEPGGLHLMLMGPEPLKAGQQVPLTLEFANGLSRSFSAIVRRRDH